MTQAVRQQLGFWLGRHPLLKAEQVPPGLLRLSREHDRILVDPQLEYRFEGALIPSGFETTEAVDTQVLVAELSPKPILAIEAGPLPGWQQILLPGEVIWLSPGGAYSFQGQLYRRQGQDWQALNPALIRQSHRLTIDRFLSQPRLVFQGLRQDRWAYVFTELGCPDCIRQLDHNNAWLAEGYRLAYLPFAHQGIGSPQYHQWSQILCGEEPQWRFLQLMRQMTVIPVPACQLAELDQQIQLGRWLGIHSLPAYLLEDGRLLQGLQDPRELPALP